MIEAREIVSDCDRECKSNEAGVGEMSPKNASWKIEA